MLLYHSSTRSMRDSYDIHVIKFSLNIAFSHHDKLSISFFGSIE